MLHNEHIIYMYNYTYIKYVNFICNYMYIKHFFPRLVQEHTLNKLII